LHSATSFFYQDSDPLISEKISVSLDHLVEIGVIQGLSWIAYRTPQFTRSLFRFKMNGSAKSLNVFKANVQESLANDIMLADFICGYNTFITDAMLGLAKKGAIILDLPRPGAVEYKISDEQVRRFGLMPTVFESELLKEFTFYQKR